jgi:hypothetical protein
LAAITGTNTGDQDLSTLVTGPASATDNTIPSFDGATGKLLQESLITSNGSSYIQIDGGVRIYDDTIENLADVTTTNSLQADVFIQAPDTYTDEVHEFTTNAGVTVDGVLIKDGLVYQPIKLL